MAVASCVWAFSFLAYGNPFTAGFCLKEGVAMNSATTKKRNAQSKNKLSTIGILAMLMLFLLSISLFGCSESAEPSDSQKQFMENTALLNGIRDDSRYDEKWTREKTSHGCYKVTYDFKYDVNGNTKKSSRCMYFKDALHEDECPQYLDHLSKNL